MDVVYKVKGKEFKGKKEAAAFERIYDAVELLVDEHCYNGMDKHEILDFIMEHITDIRKIK